MACIISSLFHAHFQSGVARPGGGGLWERRGQSRDPVCHVHRVRAAGDIEGGQWCGRESLSSDQRHQGVVHHDLRRSTQGMTAVHNVLAVLSSVTCIDVCVFVLCACSI